MKFLNLFAAASLCLVGQFATAEPTKTKARDALGTTFIVVVDWDARIVAANLRANPSRLINAKLERSLQNAVYNSSAVGCKMLEKGRKTFGQNETVGILYCPWFDKPARVIR